MPLVLRTLDFPHPYGVVIPQATVEELFEEQARELGVEIRRGFNCCQTQNDYDQFESILAWVLKTLQLHTRDERSYDNIREQFERAKTHDPLWNTAQTQLVREGRVQNYLRMLWGKKILEWTRPPAKALEMMVELNNKYALDGRDPNSYSGIFWCLGRYDRPWGPERPIFGTVRYMSSENTARKFNVREHVREYSSPSESVTLGK
jgi:deoxyribodipyrimidine photo-lyase